MTDEQKKRIIFLRQHNVSFVDIANELRIPSATVKTFCYRKKIVPLKQGALGQLRTVQNARGEMPLEMVEQSSGFGESEGNAEIHVQRLRKDLHELCAEPEVLL